MPSQFCCQQRPPIFGVAVAANPSEPVVHLFTGLGELLPEHCFDPAGGLLVLDHADEVVGIAHQMALALDIGFETFLEPQVEYVVQEDVGQHEA